MPYGNPDQSFGVEPLSVLYVQPELTEVNIFIESLKRRLKIFREKEEKLPFKDNTFDIVVCNDVIDHVKDCEEVLNEIYRSLEEGGLFLFSVDVFSLIEVLKWNYYTKKFFKNSPNVLCYPHTFRFVVVENMLKKHGIKVKHSNVVEFDFKTRFAGKAKKARFIGCK